MEILSYFWMFLRASLFSIGGMGSLPFLHSDLTYLGLAEESDFLTAIAVGQLSPGPSGLWSISLGYLIMGWPGALMALLAISLPPLLVVGVVNIYEHVERFSSVQNFGRGLALGVIGLTLSVTLGLTTSTVKDAYGWAIVVISFLMVISKRIPVFVILILAAIAGCLLYGF